MGKPRAGSSRMEVDTMKKREGLRALGGSTRPGSGMPSASGGGLSARFTAIHESNKGKNKKDAAGGKKLAVKKTLGKKPPGKDSRRPKGEIKKKVTKKPHKGKKFNKKPKTMEEMDMEIDNYMSKKGGADGEGGGNAMEDDGGPAKSKTSGRGRNSRKKGKNEKPEKSVNELDDEMDTYWKAKE